MAAPIYLLPNVLLTEEHEKYLSHTEDKAVFETCLFERQRCGAGRMTRMTALALDGCMAKIRQEMQKEGLHKESIAVKLERELNSVEKSLDAAQLSLDRRSSCICAKIIKSPSFLLSIAMLALGAGCALLTGSVLLSLGIPFLLLAAALIIAGVGITLLVGVTK